ESGVARLAHGARKRARAGRAPRPRSARIQGACAAHAGAGRSQGFRRPLSVRAVGRDAPAGRDCAGAHPRRAAAADGRAFRCARCTDTRADAPRPRSAVAGDPQDRAVHHALDRRGRAARRSRRRHVAAARKDRVRNGHRALAPTRARSTARPGFRRGDRTYHRDFSCPRCAAWSGRDTDRRRQLNMNITTLQGIVAAPALPMLPDYTIDWSTLRTYLRWIANQRPTAIAMNMDASEGPALDRDEQLEVLRASRDAIQAACPLISGLIAGSTRDAVRWGNELKVAGAHALAVFPPFPTFLGKPVPAEMIYQYYKAIADGVGLPLAAFQFPVAW